MYKIIIDEAGQTCNRFWSYLDTIGWAISEKKKIYIIYWDKSIRYYDKLRKSRYVSFPLYNKWLANLLGDKLYNFYVHRLFPNNRFFCWLLYKKGYAKKYGLIKGWEHRSDTYFFPKYLDIIRSLFTPNPDICRIANDIINPYKKNGFFVIGVHIRRGDYKDFDNGRHFFEYEFYIRIMYQLIKLYSDKHVCFYISTNEKYPNGMFKDFYICESDNKNVAVDLQVLSMCDRIIGPLSTFSRWASLMGNVPLCFLKNSSIMSDDNQFSPIKSMYHFANGLEIENLTKQMQNCEN